MAYTLPFSICTLAFGMLKGGFNRKRFLSTVMLVASTAMLLTGNVTSLAVLAGMRVLHAMCNSTFQPLVYSITADYFPKSQRGMANAILQSASYIGIALGSISLILINNAGWRGAYSFMGGLGLVLSSICFLFIKEPHLRKRFQAKYHKDQSNL